MDEGIKEKFFSDLRCLFDQKPEVDSLIQGFENVGLKGKQIDTSSEDMEDLSSDGDFSISNRDMQHPIRPDAENCSFFVRTGTCRFGRMCRFNHPVSTKIYVDRGKSNIFGAGSSSKSLSRIPCKFYQIGHCKYGESCRFNHSKSEPENSLPRLNVLGFPERLGCENCSFYMRTGVCGYGASCKFHHPPPIFFTVESMDSQNEASEINEGDAGHVVPHFSQSTNSHVRVLKFGSFPSVTSGNLEKNQHPVTDGSSTSESPSGGKTK
ncbi:zinc finger CCCH domain-containing protein 43 [Lactuca sativa]|uniref:zinc finger CCCH domain-containing protein 43 n=1 Tax=Lactuca sativa TaxID=4236 RepID=UPI000CD8A84C|nr:zinc finger CCCH domain-containing protein 43 [Lactuca sativa]